MAFCHGRFALPASPFRHGLPAIALLALLSACTTLGMGGGTAALRTVTDLTGDLSDVIVALDLPQALAPAPGTTRVKFDIVAPGSGERHLELALAPADASDVAEEFPAPAAGRLYYFLAFAAADRARLREVQAWSRSLPAAQPAPQIALALTTDFCARGPVDLDKAEVSALLRSPTAARVQPLIDRGKAKSLMRIDAPLTAC